MIDERMYQANIELVDKNKLLEEDKRILQKRLDTAIEYIEEKEQQAEQKFISIPNKFVDYEVLEKILKILKGEYFNER